MQLALECPIPLMQKFQQYANFDFILTHLVKDSVYSDYYKSSSKFKILDNSTNELGLPCSVEEILEAAKIVQPDYVCPPDFLGDAYRTMEAIEEMEIKLPSNMFILPILQCDGDSYSSIRHFLSFLRNRNYNCIAIPYDIMRNRNMSIKELSRARYEIVSYLPQNLEWIHLLGCTDPSELYQYRKMDNVRSLDTGSPITNGLASIRYGEHDPLPKSSMLDFSVSSITPKQEIDILHNINYLRVLMEGYDEWLL